MSTKTMSPKRVKFNTKYVVKKQIDFVKVVPEMYNWIKIILKTDDRKVWEAFLPKDHSIEVGTVITFTRWMLDEKTRDAFTGIEDKSKFVLLHHESELKNEDFLIFQIEGSDVEYSTNLKDVDEFEEVK